MSLTLTTPPDEQAPVPSGSFESVTETSFSFVYNQSEPGVVYYILVVPRDQAELPVVVLPGAELAQQQATSVLNARNLTEAGSDLINNAKVARLMRAGWSASVHQFSNC